MDNLGIARILREIADLLEIKNDNAFKIRAYRNGADIVANHPHALAVLDAAELRGIPGIGKDLAARIVEIGATGDAEFHRELIAEFPPTILDLLHLQGVGPKTVATLYRELNIRTLDDLERRVRRRSHQIAQGHGREEGSADSQGAGGPQAATRDGTCCRTTHDIADRPGRLPAGARPGSADHPGRQPAARLRHLRRCRHSRRRRHPALAAAFTSYPLVERVLAQGETKSSVLLNGGFQADLRLVPLDSHGAALQYFTGSKAHNIALRDRAIGMGLKLNEYGVFRTADDSRVAGASEEDVYAALGLDWIPPELREYRGEIEAAEAKRLPRLVDRADLRGDLHMHTTATDGKDSHRGHGRRRRARPVSSTSPSPTTARRWRWRTASTSARALAHAARVRGLDGHAGVRLLAGIECDIRPTAPSTWTTSAWPPSTSSSSRSIRRSPWIARR